MLLRIFLTYQIYLYLEQDSFEKKLMLKNNNSGEVAIINRGFWPVSDVPGASLLALAEKISQDQAVYVLTQSNLDIQKFYKTQGGRAELNIRSCKSLTNSNSNIYFRVIETVYFTLWTLFHLIRIRPKKIYVATDPPIVLPFIVGIYSKIFNSSYTYHVQDIHPEASRGIIKMPLFIYKLLICVDTFSLRNAKSIVTLTKEMADYISNVRWVTTPIHLVNNASLFPIKNLRRKQQTIIFCGNAGRLQEIPLLVSSIDLYLKRGGCLKFTFMGAGVNSHLFKQLSDRWDNVNCLEYLPLQEAIEILSQHEWSLIPLNDQVSNFAFPSKTSAAIAAGCKIFAVCNLNSSLSQWVHRNGFGIVTTPIVENIVSTFNEIESGKYNLCKVPTSEDSIKYSFDYFSNSLIKIIHGN